MLRIEGMNTHYGASHILQGLRPEMPRAASAPSLAGTASAIRRW